MINNMGSLIAEVQRLQQELKTMAVEISEGEGALKIIINGHQEVLEVTFSPSVLRPGNCEALQAMLVTAMNRAITESKQMIKGEIGKITGGMNLPNIPGLF